jgi:DNA-binding transcriptional regulator YdaS (Cro superfamily)
MTTHAIERAAQLAGGQSALARKLGCTPQAVSKMCSTGKVPAERVIPVERAVDGAVTRHELRPDLYPMEQATEQASA